MIRAAMKQECDEEVHERAPERHDEHHHEDDVRQLVDGAAADAARVAPLGGPAGDLRVEGLERADEAYGRVREELGELGDELLERVEGGDACREEQGRKEKKD